MEDPVNIPTHCLPSLIPANYRMLQLLKLGN